MSLVLSRRRREILARKSVFIDLLSWRYASVASSLPVGFQSPIDSRLRRSGVDSAQQQVQDQTRERRGEFKSFMELLDSRIEADQFSKVDRLCEELDLRYSPTGSAVGSSSVSLEHSSQDNQLVEDVCSYLTQAGYHLASNEDWVYAKEHNYGFSVPLRVQWSMYDKEFLRTLSPRLYSEKMFWTAGNSTNGMVNMPQEANHALVFHRGVGVDRSTRYYFGEKSDELIRRGVLWAYKALLRSVRRLGAFVSRHARNARNNSVQRSASLFGKAKANVQRFYAEKIASTVYVKPFSWFERIIRSRISKLQSPLAGMDLDVSIALPESLRSDVSPKVPNPKQPEPKQHELPLTREEKAQTSPELIEPNVLEHVALNKDMQLEEAFQGRVSLTDYKLSLLNFFRQQTLQEPTYKQVVLIYRARYPPAPTVGFTQAKNFKLLREELADISPNARNIYIKVFRDVPMSDLELLMPEKQVYLSVSDRFNYGLMGLIGGTALLDAIFSTGSGFLANPAWIAAVVASGTYFSRVLSRVYMSWAYYSSVTRSFLADNIIATGSSAIASISKEARDQLVKEVAVTVLAMIELSAAAHAQGKPCALTMQEITSCALHILHQKYSQDAAFFDPANAVDFLLKERILSTTTSHGEVLYALNNNLT